MSFLDTVRNGILSRKGMDAYKEPEPDVAEHPLFLDGFGQYGKMLDIQQVMDRNRIPTYRCFIAPDRTMIMAYGIPVSAMQHSTKLGLKYIKVEFHQNQMINLNPSPKNPTWLSLLSIKHKPSPLIDKLRWFNRIKELEDQLRSAEHALLVKDHWLNMAMGGVEEYIDRNVEIFKKAQRVRGRTEDVEQQEGQGEVQNA